MINDLLLETHGCLAIATLNRPAALNAQTLAMVKAFRAALASWEADPEVTRLLICGAGDKAFCAGGDVKAIWREPPALRYAFFDQEYDLCAALRTTRLETVAYLDGITMGGGVGLSIYADHRLTTPRTRWAMPETRLGFFPDIAASHFFTQRIEPALGRYLALTGAQLSGADCLAAGVATAFVAAGQSEALAERLAAGVAVTDIIGSLAMAPPETALPVIMPEDAVTPLPAFLAHLSGRGLLPDGLCGLSLKVTDEALRRGRKQDHAATVAMDKVLVQNFLAGTTFSEGARALLMDRDNRPDWMDVPLTAVRDAAVESCFTPLFTDSSAHASILEA